jgi:hypothetical protein
MLCEDAKAEAIRQSHRRWVQTRLRGRQRYVWVHGVVGWGILFALGQCGGLFLSGRFHPVVTLAIVAYSAVGGYFVGAAEWKHNEEAHRTGRAEEIG